MKKIYLFCNAGMSTSMLVNKMKEAAKDKNIDIEIEAYPVATIEKYLSEASAVLLGPQIRFSFARIKKLCDKEGVGCEVISTMDYGMMNGEKVLEQGLRLIK